MSKKHKIVKVAASSAPGFSVKYVKLSNANPDEMIAYAQEHQNIHIFNFLDLPKEALPDFNKLTNAVQAHRLYSPIWLGNIPKEQRASFVNQVIDHAFEEFAEEIIDLTHEVPIALQYMEKPNA